MSDPAGLLAAGSSAYLAALTGCGIALVARVGFRRRRQPLSLAEARWCVFFPLGSALLLPLIGLLPMCSVAALGISHQLWYQWEAALHRSSLTHTILHTLLTLLLLGFGVSVLRVVHVLARVQAMGHSLRRMAIESGSGPEEPVQWITSARPLCFTFGLLRPAVYVTTGLRDHITPSELEAVLAHERAHAARRDTVVGTLLHVFFTAFPLPGSRLLLSDWQRAAERACDQDAARQVGRYNLADALISVTRVVGCGHTPMPFTAGFLGCKDDIEGRVRELLDPVSQTRGNRLAAIGFTSVTVALSAALWLPHVVALFVHAH